MKIHSVQYMRGIAALLVVIAHSLEHPLKHPSFEFIRTGRLGVLMFFVVSGFIMVFITGDKPLRPLEFLRRRAIRVVPLYWLATFGVAAVCLLAPNLLKTTVMTGEHLLMSLLFIPHWGPGHTLAPLLKLGWTLNYEFFFYAWFAALFFLGAVARVIALTILFLGFSIAGSLHAFQNPLLAFYFSYLTIGFCSGAWIALAALKGRFIPRKPYQQGLAVIAGLAAIGLGYLVEPGTRGAELTALCLILGASLLLLAGLGAESWMPRIAPLEKLGDASYSLYLAHMYWIAAALKLLDRAAPGLPMPIAIGVCVIGAIIVGIAVYELCERPLLRLFQRPARPQPTPPEAILTVPADGLHPGNMP